MSGLLWISRQNKCMCSSSQQLAICEERVKMFLGFGSCRIMEFLTQQFYFREPVQLARVKIILLLDPRRAWFQQLHCSAQKRDCSKKWAVWKCHDMLLQHGHLLTIFHVISNLFNTKGLFKMPKILLQKYTWISHLHLLIKLFCLFKEHWVGDKDIFLSFHWEPLTQNTI